MSENFNSINLEVIKRDESRQIKAVAIDMQAKNIGLFESGHFYKDCLKPYVRKYGYEKIDAYLKSLAGEITGIVKQDEKDPEFDA